MYDELDEQVGFLIELDKLKGVYRRSPLMDGSRYENTAEHSWHVAVCATVFARYATSDVDISRVVRMLLVHDIVEIDAGDTFAYDATGRIDQFDREQLASERIFGLLPADQGKELASLWAEFDALETPDSRFANAVDRFLPVLHNYHNQGHSWKKHGVSRTQVDGRVACIEAAAPSLWPYVTALLDDAVRRGYLAP